jgi:hypothetical protein
VVILPASEKPKFVHQDNPDDGSHLPVVNLIFLERAWHGRPSTAGWRFRKGREASGGLQIGGKKRSVFKDTLS